MALKGNLSEFNITNIIQMVSVEGKTGILKVFKDRERINITFYDGRIVSCEKDTGEDDDRLKGILVTHNYISPSDLDKAVMERTKSLMPFFSILKKYVLLSHLKNLHSKQIKDYIFSVLRWDKGEYEFISQRVEFDKEIVTPFDVEFLLMEGCRILDEWREIEKNLSKAKRFIKKNIFDEKSLLLNDEKDETVNLEAEILKKRGIEPDERGKDVLMLLNNFHTIDEIVRVSRFGEFETCQTIDRFLSQNIIVSYKKKRLTPRIDGSGSEKQTLSYHYMDIFLKAAIFTLIIGINIYFFVYRYKSISSILTAHTDSYLKVKGIKIKNEKDKIESAIYYYYQLKGCYPESLGQVYDVGLLKQKNINKRSLSRYNYSIKKDCKGFLLSLIK